MNRRVVCCAAAALGLVLRLSSASAQTPGQARPPGTVQPGQVERQFERPPEPTAKPGAIAIPDAGQTPPANAEGIRFTLTQITIDGVTVYSDQQLRRLYAGVLNTEVTLASVYRLVDRITARYRNDGYILSQVIVPAQSIDNGVIRLQAVEGFIADVRVEGGSASVRRRVQRYGEKIRTHKPLTAGALERYVLLMNDLPGVQARAILAPSQTPGASDLVLRVSRTRISYSASLDDRGSRAQGKQRVFATAEVTDVLGASRTEIREVTTATPELTYTALAHEQILPWGGKVGVTGSYVYSRPEELSVVPLDLTTKSGTVTATYTHPLVRSRVRNLYLNAAFSSFDSSSTIFNLTDTTDRVRELRVGITYDMGDAFGGVNIADVEYSQGLLGLGSSRNSDAFLSRPTGRADFQKATLYAARIQSLPARFSAVLAVTGQYAFTDLLAPQLFGVGGEQFGRGYDPSELLNDHGAAAKLDVRYTRAWGRRLAITATPYAFFDVGQVWQRTPSAGLERSQAISSAGFGGRVSVGSRLSGFVEFAKPLDRVVGQENNHSARVYAGVSIQ